MVPFLVNITVYTSLDLMKSIAFRLGKVYLCNSRKEKLPGNEILEL
jgi:hypothetical protein